MEQLIEKNEFLELFIEIGGLKPNHRVLGIGDGQPDLTEYLTTEKYTETKITRESIERRFPFKDKSFDFIFSLSVFTSLLPPEQIFYTREIARLLVRGKVFYHLFFAQSGVRRAFKRRAR